MASKFFLVFLLAALLEPSELGMYGLFVATISYAVYPLGFDFYTYSTREILKTKRNSWGGILKSQGTLHLTLYLFVLPLLSLLFLFYVLPWEMALYFYALLITEHLNQEFVRFFTAISKPLTASLIFFMRSGMWALIAATAMLHYESMRNLNTIITLWLTGSFTALAFAALSLLRMNIKGWHASIDTAWILVGLKKAAPFLMATLAIRGILTFDRYLIEAQQGLEPLGAYVLFMGIASAMLIFVDAGISAFCDPKLITSYNQKDPETYRNTLRSYAWQTLIFVTVYILLSTLTLNLMLSIIGNDIYLRYSELYPLIVLSIGLYAISNVPHYGLYAQGKDKHIIYTHLLCLVAFLFTVKLLTELLIENAVAYGLLSTFFLLLISKSILLFKVTPAKYINYKPTLPTPPS